MQIKCEFCGAFMNDTDAKCPACGAENKKHKEAVITTPKTIEQLKDWYKARNLPPYEKTRFFIGEDYKGKRAFGIYKEGDEFIVYKNKDDGTRAIRYHGKDEAYAVNELYLKLKSEIVNQKTGGNNSKSRSGNSSYNNKNNVRVGTAGSRARAYDNGPIKKTSLLIWFCSMLVLTSGIKFEIFFFLLLIPLVVYFCAKRFFTPRIHVWVKRGLITYLAIASLAWVYMSARTYEPHYYQYDNDVYVTYKDDYYIYDYSTNDYSPVTYSEVPTEVKSNPNDYEYDATGINWDSSYSFEASNYYVENLKPAESTYSGSDSDSSSSWDWSSNSSYNWNSGSNWSSNYTNWGSNW